MVTGAYMPEGPPPPQGENGNSSGGGGHYPGGQAAANAFGKSNNDPKKYGGSAMHPRDCGPNNPAYVQGEVSRMLGYDPYEGLGRRPDGSYDVTPVEGNNGEAGPDVAAPAPTAAPRPSAKSGDPYAGRGKF